jgi:hypothetical protein
MFLYPVFIIGAIIQLFAATIAFTFAAESPSTVEAGHW